MWETRVRSLGREGPLEKELATHSSILAWKIPWTEELDGLQSVDRKESDTTERLHFHFHVTMLTSFTLLYLITWAFYLLIYINTSRMSTVQ